MMNDDAFFLDGFGNESATKVTALTLDARAWALYDPEQEDLDLPVRLRFARRLLRFPAIPLPWPEHKTHQLADLWGGIYAITYNKTPDRPTLIEAPYPLYIGSSWTESKDGTERKGALRTRVLQHRASLDAVGLDAQNFAFRFIPLDDFWILSVEKQLIKQLRPLWDRLEGVGTRPGTNGVRAGRNVKRSDFDMAFSDLGKRACAAEGTGRSREEIEREFTYKGYGEECRRAYDAVRARVALP